MLEFWTARKKEGQRWAGLKLIPIMRKVAGQIGTAEDAAPGAAMLSGQAAEMPL
jgi:hypothetical protein